jgi:hypothetical protein
VSRRKKSGSSQATNPDGKNRGGKPDRSHVAAERKVQHLANKRGLTQRQVRDLIGEHLAKATELLSGGVVHFYPPAIDSAVGIGPKTIQLKFHYVIEEISTFRFKRKNLTLGTTKEIEAVVNPGSFTRMFNDNGLDPTTSYAYQVAAVHPPDFPVLAGKVYWNTSQIPVTATTLDTAGDPWFETTLQYDSAGWEGRCLVQRIEPRALSKSGTQVQLTLRASSTAPYGAFIDRVTISKAVVGFPANPYDSGSPPTELAPKFDIRGGESLTLPWVPYKLYAQEPQLVAVDFKYPPWPSAIRYRQVRPLLLLGTAYWRAGAEAALSPRSENYQAEDRIYLVERIQVR